MKDGSMFFIYTGRRRLKKGISGCLGNMVVLCFEKGLLLQADPLIYNSVFLERAVTST
eukprot:m.193955 g.193955  ORF g.193955 m.193955 type:complete len:58 (+) comp16786_c0_seq1:4750-4923(+)